MIVSDTACRNGIRVVVVDRPGSSAVELAAVVLAGWRHDPPSAVGTAHLTEHLLTVGADDVARGVESVGGSFAATTHPDHMQFVTTAPVSLWPDLVAAEVRRLHGHMSVRGNDIDVQRAAVAQEIRAAAASPSPWPAMTTALYRDDALGHDGFGDLGHLNRIDTAVCARFARAVVRPERATLVVALNASLLRGPTAIADVVDGVRATPSVVDGPVRDAYPVSWTGRPRTVRAGGVTNTWCGWSVPGMTRSFGDHLRWFGVASVLELRTTAHRFGRAGVGHVGDRETLAVSASSIEEVAAHLERRVTTPEYEHACRRLRGAVVDFEHDAAAIARLVAFTGAPTISPPRFDPGDLDDALTNLRRTTPAVVTPDPHASVDTSARPSSAQTPRPTRRRPITFVQNAIRTSSGRTRARGSHAAAMVTAGPTHVHVRTHAPFSSARWGKVTDFSGHRYATRVESAERLADAVADLPDVVAELAAAGSLAEEALRHPVTAHPDTGVSIDDGAARWLALGALNSVHRIAVGAVPTVRVLRLPTRPQATTVVVDRDTDLHGLVEEWTPVELDHTRTFCAGQTLTATASGRDTADVLLTLLCNDIRVGDDPLERFAATLLATRDADIRAAAHEILETTRAPS